MIVQLYFSTSDLECIESKRDIIGIDSESDMLADQRKKKKRKHKHHKHKKDKLIERDDGRIERQERYVKLIIQAGTDGSTFRNRFTWTTRKCKVKFLDRNLYSTTGPLKVIAEVLSQLNNCRAMRIFSIVPLRVNSSRFVRHKKREPATNAYLWRVNIVERVTEKGTRNTNAPRKKEKSKMDHWTIKFRARYKRT